MNFELHNRFLFLFFLCITLIPIKSFSQDHLEPTNYFLGEYDFYRTYYNQVYEYYFDEFVDNPEIQIIVIPSFSSERLFQITRKSAQNGGGLKAKYLIGENSVWYDVYSTENPISKSEFKFKIYESEITQIDFELLSQLFKTVIRDTKYQDSNNMGLDGVTYYFTVSDYGLKSGQIWSPDSESRMGKFIEITNLIFEGIKSEDFKLDQVLKSKILELVQLIDADQ